MLFALTLLGIFLYFTISKICDTVIEIKKERK